MKRNLIAAAVAAAVLGVAGCATAPKNNATLENARSALRAAESDAGVAKYAPTELNKAQTLLANAEGASKEGTKGMASTNHYAYLATQMAHVAEQRSQEQVAMARIKAGEVERQKILLSARENEANNALSQARAAQTDAERARAEAQNALAQNQALQSQLADLQAKQTPRGIVLTLSDVLFDTGKAELKPGAQRSIDEIAKFLSAHPERSVQVEGFTDAQGPNDYNLALSQRRADSVASAIIQRGVESQRVRALGYGEDFPKASNDNAGSRQLNRRVEIIVANDDQAIPSRTASTP